jgi:hypothetical protein
LRSSARRLDEDLSRQTDERGLRRDERHHGLKTRLPSANPSRREHRAACDQSSPCGFRVRTRTIKADTSLCAIVPVDKRL